MPRLTDTQRVLLSGAARRDDGALLPLPKHVEIEPRTLTRVLKGLLEKGLVREQPATPEATAWRDDPESGRQMLVVTPAGLDAIGVVDEEVEQQTKSRKVSSARSHKTKSERQTKSVQKAPIRPGTKLATIIDLLHRDEGASIAEIVDATGWQPHSVRGAISGSLRKKLGLTISSEAVEGRGRVYRIGNKTRRKGRNAR